MAGSDYVTTTIYVASLPSTVPQQYFFYVPVYSDTTVELTETLYALLTNPVGATVDGPAGSGEIVNDDSSQIWIQDPPPELENGGDPRFRVNMSAVVDVDVLFYYATVDGSASVADGDYYPRSLRLSIEEGSLYNLIRVSVVSDNKVELDESFGVSLYDLDASGRNVTFLDNTATATILNDDSATLSIGDVAAAEGDSGPTVFSFDVSLDQEVDVGVEVDFNTADGTATVANNDYESTFGTLIFDGSAGQVKTLNVTVNGDTNPGPDETFFVNLSNVFASGRDVTLADSQGQGTILTDDTVIFSDGFESGDTTLWSTTVP
jgi:hypothetical protein